MICCLCDTIIKIEPGGWSKGHNPAPLMTGKEDRCCNDCNTFEVIPERLQGIGLAP